MRRHFFWILLLFFTIFIIGYSYSINSIDTVLGDAESSSLIDNFTEIGNKNESENNTFFDNMVKIFTVLNTFILTYLGFKTIGLERHKHKIDLFDRRLKVYNDIYEFLTKVMQKGRIYGLSFENYQDSISLSKFIFPEKEAEYLNELDKRISKFRIVDMNIQTQLDPESKEAILKEFSEDLNWLLSERVNLHKRLPSMKMYY